MQRKKLCDGTIIARIRTPHGDGYDYYEDTGPIGGLIFIGTTSTPESRRLNAEMVIWDREQNYTEPKDPNYVYKFNDLGWRH